MHNIIAQLLIVRSVAWPKDDVILALKIFDAEGYFAILSCVKSESQNSVRYLLAIAGLGGLLYGIDFGVIAAASPYIKALRLFSDAELSWIVGAVLFGGIVSSLTAGMLAERFGRKRMIVASAALFLVAIPTVCLSEKSLLRSDMLSQSCTALRMRRRSLSRMWLNLPHGRLTSGGRSRLSRRSSWEASDFPKARCGCRV